MDNSDKFWKIIDNADSFSARTNNKEIEFGWAKQVNLAFAVELFLKSIMEYESGKIKYGHNLKTLFEHIDTKSQEIIYDNWRKLSGTNIPNNNQIKGWFWDNIFACANIFERFRYVHEWASGKTDLEASWNDEQYNQLSIFSESRDFGKLQTYGSFLKEFENAIKKYIRENVIPKLPRRSHDIEIACENVVTITRADGSTKTERNKVVVPLNITKSH